jgi:hypothetical protein
MPELVYYSYTIMKSEWCTLSDISPSRIYTHIYIYICKLFAFGQGVLSGMIGVAMRAHTTKPWELTKTVLYYTAFAYSICLCGSTGGAKVKLD